jgi:PAS domain S-box-containing protein
MSIHDLVRALGPTADGALITDKDQNVIYWNLAAERMLGFAPDDAVGQPCYEVLQGCHDEDRSICRKHCQVRAAVLAGQPVTDYDLCVRKQSGDEQWINISTLVFAADDKADGPLLVHLFRDATEATQNKAFVQRVLDTVSRLRGKQSFPPASPAPAPCPLADLTGREGEVLDLLARGLGTDEIADALSISPSTVRNHIRNIMNKYHVHSRLEAVLYALQHGLVDK